MRAKNDEKAGAATGAARGRQKSETSKEQRGKQEAQRRRRRPNREDKVGGPFVGCRGGSSGEDKAKVAGSASHAAAARASLELSVHQVANTIYTMCVVNVAASCALSRSRLSRPRYSSLFSTPSGIEAQLAVHAFSLEPSAPKTLAE